MQSCRTGTKGICRGTRSLPRSAFPTHRVAIASIAEGLSAPVSCSDVWQMLVQYRAADAHCAWGRCASDSHPSIPSATLLPEVWRFRKQSLRVVRAGFPPFAHLALLRAECADQPALFTFLREAQEAASASSGIDLSPPLSAPMALRDGKHRGQMLLSARQRPRLQALLENLVPNLRAMRSARRVRWSIDVDPVDLY